MHPMQSSAKLSNVPQSHTSSRGKGAPNGGEMSRPNNESKLGKQLRVGLFVPCYIDMMFPEVGIATLQLLERFGLNVGYPMNQTCCGQLSSIFALPIEVRLEYDSFP
jgi:Fe-S oxidoreductase